MPGRPGKFEPWLTETGLLLIEGWARDGYTDKQIAEEKIGVTERTFTDWKARFGVISSALKKGKAPVDFQVENALLKRALGYTITETIEEYDGKVAKPGEKIKPRSIKRITKEVPPDVTAIIYWLKNRKPQYWRDKREYNDQVPADDPLNKLLGELDAQCAVQ